MYTGSEGLPRYEWPVSHLFPRTLVWPGSRSFPLCAYGPKAIHVHYAFAAWEPHMPTMFRGQGANPCSCMAREPIPYSCVAWEPIPCQCVAWEPIPYIHGPANQMASEPTPTLICLGFLSQSPVHSWPGGQHCKTCCIVPESLYISWKYASDKQALSEDYVHMHAVQSHLFGGSIIG